MLIKLKFEDLLTLRFYKFLCIRCHSRYISLNLQLKIILRCLRNGSCLWRLWHDFCQCKCNVRYSGEFGVVYIKNFHHQVNFPFPFHELNYIITNLLEYFFKLNWSKKSLCIQIHQVNSEIPEFIHLYATI